MRISAGLLEALELLLAGETVASSRLRRDMAEVLIDEGLLTVRAYGTRRVYKAIDREALGRWLSRHDELRDLDLARHLLAGDGVTRHEQASATGDSKMYKVRSCPGFPVNCFNPLKCRLNGKVWLVDPPEGSFVFVSDWRQFEIPEDVVVVGVENMENFRLIRQQEAFFAKTVGASGERLLFVSRFPQSTDLREWLKGIPNRYVHFGDFDLAGISIFQTEFQRHLGERSSFLIPPDIEQRLAGGSRKRYNEQLAKCGSVASSDTELQALIDTIRRYHRCYDQEGYIGAWDGQ